MDVTPPKPKLAKKKLQLHIRQFPENCLKIGKLFGFVVLQDAKARRNCFLHQLRFVFGSLTPRVGGMEELLEQVTGRPEQEAKPGSGMSFKWKERRTRDMVAMLSMCETLSLTLGVSCIYTPSASLGMVLGNLE